MKKLSFKKELEYNLTLKSLIGYNISILGSKNKNQIGISGKIIFESANFITILLKKNIEKSILKTDLIISLKYGENQIKFNCNSLNNSIVHRLKKLR